MRRSPDRSAPGVYVHVPFCSRVCPYCDFAVTPLGRSGADRLERYREALLAEIRLRAASLGADTVYFGGGTPSLVPPEGIREIVEAVVSAGLARPAPWVILEANPEDVAGDDALARRWSAAGVSGVSLGAQSLRKDRLRFLGRRHSPADVRRSAELLLEAGIRWRSADLIYGEARSSKASGSGRLTPLSALAAELEAVAALPGLTHLSAYELTIEPGTPFGRRAAAGERLLAAGRGAAFRLVHETLAACGFEAYEASNFARTAADRSRHNPKYWEGAPYVGLGPSAHSFDPDRSERSWNHREVPRWRDAVLRGEIPIEGREVLTAREQALETVFLGLRTVAGLDLAELPGEVEETNRERFRRWEEAGLVSTRAAPTGLRLAPTLEGLAVSDSLAREVDLRRIPDESREAA